MKRRGFTLIELMLALMISTMILGAASVALVTMVDSHERGSQVAAELKEGQAIADLIERHLRAAMTPDSADNVVFEGEDLSGDQIDGHRLTLLSTAPGRFPRSAPLRDAAEVTFELDPETGDGLNMRIDATPDDLPNEGGYNIPLGEDVRSFGVKYYDGTDWRSSWSEQSLPVAVQFTLTFEPKANEESAADAKPAAESSATPFHTVSRMMWLPLGQDVTQTSSTQQSTQAGAGNEAKQAGSSTPAGQGSSTGGQAASAGREGRR